MSEATRTLWRRAPRRVSLCGLIILLSACSGSGDASGRGTLPSAGQAADSGSTVGASKRLTAVIMSDPPVLTGAATSTGSDGQVPGLDSLEDLLHVGMTDITTGGSLRPVLARDVPSIDNALWTVEPDGGMELTWTIRPGAVWHDGAPVTSEDFRFTATLAQDRDLPTFGNPVRNPGWELVDRVESPDASTFTVHWKQPFINADALFTRLGTLPLPEHLLDQPYRADKASFAQLPYWNQQFVGTGPFRLREFVSGSHILLDANDQYVLGRPRIDVIDIAIVTDATSVVTQVLAGRADVTLGARLSLDQGLDVRDHWSDGQVEFDVSMPLAIFPQFVNPDPPIIGNVQFLRALQSAIDREQLVGTLMSGVSQVADTTLIPNDHTYQDVQSAITRYPYDPGRAMQLMEGLGYSRGTDGMYRDANGVVLNVEARATALSDIQPKALSAVAEYWRQLGIGVSEVVIPNQQVLDREYRSTRPGFEVLVTGVDLGNFRSSQIPLPQNNFVGNNRSRYSNPILDALLEQYFRTIPPDQRVAVLRQVVGLMSDQLPILGLLYNTTTTAVAHQVLNVGGRGATWTESWNAEQWEMS